jgi:hypothetical protein
VHGENYGSEEGLSFSYKEAEKLKCCQSVGLRISVKFCEEKGGYWGCRIKQILVNLQQEFPFSRVE